MTSKSRITNSTLRRGARAAGLGVLLVIEIVPLELIVTVVWPVVVNPERTSNNSSGRDGAKRCVAAATEYSATHAIGDVAVYRLCVGSSAANGTILKRERSDSMTASVDVLPLRVSKARRACRCSTCFHTKSSRAKRQPAGVEAAHFAEITRMLRMESPRSTDPKRFALTTTLRYPCSYANLNFPMSILSI